MKNSLLSLALLVLVGSPALAAEEPASLSMEIVRKAKRNGDHRLAIYCLCDFLIETIEKRPQAKGLNRATLTLDLKNEFLKAGQPSKAKELSTVSNSKLIEFLNAELEASDPAKSIKVFSDGSFDVLENDQNRPGPFRNFSRCTLRQSSSIVLKKSPDYQKQLRKYWWFKMPSEATLAKAENLGSYTEPAKADQFYFDEPYTTDTANGVFEAALLFEKEGKPIIAEQNFRKLLANQYTKNNSDFRAKCIKEYTKLLEKQNRVSEAQSLESKK